MGAPVTTAAERAVIAEMLLRVPRPTCQDIMVATHRSATVITAVQGELVAAGLLAVAPRGRPKMAVRDA